MSDMSFSVIAIDGPAASGKSTVAKLIASKLAYLYVDSGAMYRAVTLLWLRLLSNQASQNRERDEGLLQGILSELRMRLEDNSRTIYVNGEDVSEAIRSNLVSQNVSYIASFPEVRSRLVEIQRSISANSNVIMDGRDIGTFVFPNARLKIFLVASPEVRAQRRLAELRRRGEDINLNQLIAEIVARDKSDATREIAPLKKADDAIEINTDNFTVLEVAEKIMDLQRLKT